MANRGDLVPADTSQDQRSVRVSSLALRISSILMIVALVGVVAIAWDSPPAKGYYNTHRAETLLKGGSYSAAQALLEDTLLIYNSPQVRLDLSYAYLARRDADRAERQARIALGMAPPHLQAAAWSQLGRVLAFAGRPGEAMDAWGRALLAAAPYSGIGTVAIEARSALWHIAMLHWSQGDWQDARDDLARLASGTDLYARSAQVKLAQLLLPTRQDVAIPSITSQPAAPAHAEPPEAAIPDLNFPGLSEGLSASDMASIADNLRLAKAAASKASQAEEGAAALDVVWGGSYLQQGENMLAVEYLQRAVSYDANYEPGQARLALALINLGEGDKATQHLDLALRLDANDPLPHHVLASLYIQREQWDLAKEQLDILAKLEPAGVETYLQWADYYRLQGDYDNAENKYIEAANLQLTGAAAPSGTNAPLALSRFYTDVRGFGCEKGLPAARESLALHPDDPASFDAIGWSLMICKQPKDALSGLEGAVKAAPDVPRYRLHLAKAYSALGRYADAREQYTRVLDLDPGGPLERLALDDLVALPR